MITMILLLLNIDIKSNYHIQLLALKTVHDFYIRELDLANVAMSSYVFEDILYVSLTSRLSKEILNWQLVLFISCNFAAI